MRKSEILFDAVTNVREDLVEGAQRFSFARARERRLRRLIPTAAGLVLVAGLGIFLAAGGLRMGAGMGADNGAGSSTAGGSDGGSWDGGAENGALADSPEGPTFTDAAGPILPLTLGEENEAITAERTVELDFDGWGAKRDLWEDHWRVGVTDRYVLTNTAETDQTVTLLYPMAGDLGELDLPEITVDGQTAETALLVGGNAGLGRNAGDWDWAALLADAGYLADALDGPKDLSGISAVVYTVSDQRGPGRYSGETLALTVSYDPEETTVLQYGFHGMRYERGDRVQYTASGFVDSPDGDWLLIVLGEDIEDPRLQGYKDGGCEAGEELSEVTGTLSRRVVALGELLPRLAEDYLSGMTGNVSPRRWDTAEAFSTAAVTDRLWEDGNILERLEDRFSQCRLADRVVWLAVQTTIPAGGRIEVEAAYTQAASLNYGPPDMDNKNWAGYSLLPRAGSNLTFTGQTARVVNLDSSQVWGGNLHLGETELVEERYSLYTIQ